jgi:hypothetical protein
VLDNVSRWAEWCICEDAELGLSIFEAGYEASYTSRSYGRGLMPDTFIDFKKQRFRWAYGAMQILKAHWGFLTSSHRNQLAPGQRYHFVAGWLPWLADGFNLLFNFAALGWSIAMINSPTKIDPPLMMFSVLPLSLFAFKIVKLVHLYRSAVGANVRQTIAAAVAGLALAHTIGFAIVKGLLTRSEPFFRTPKNADRQGLRQAFGAAREETLMLLALVLAAFGVAQMETTASPDRTTWMVVLGIQAVPYGCALLVSMASALSLPAWLVGTRYRAVVGAGVAVTTAVAEASRQPAAGPAATPAADLAPAAPAGAAASSLQPALAPAAAAVMAAAAVGGALSADQIGGNNSLGGADPAFISGSLSNRSIGNV